MNAFFYRIDTYLDFTIKYSGVDSDNISKRIKVILRLTNLNISINTNQLCFCKTKQNTRKYFIS